MSNGLSDADSFMLLAIVGIVGFLLGELVTLWDTRRRNKP